jgi:hypothetical protein
MTLEEFKEEVRQALADYMKSEGCGCCSNYEKHSIDADRLGRLLDVPLYDDGSGYDFSQFRSKE